MAGEPLCSGTNNMLITMNTCYVALKVVSPAVAVAAAVYWTEECVATLLLNLLQCASNKPSLNVCTLAFCDILHDSVFTISRCDGCGTHSMLDSTSETVGSDSSP